jgi:sigma-B regulation protein RsbU (phosphoserine phosphatase)
VPFHLKKDDVILIITDGVEEQPNEYGEEYGNRRLANILQLNRHRGLIKMKNELLYNLHEFRHTQPQYDDITMVMLEYTAEG